jgi:hypothetical protein
MRKAGNLGKYFLRRFTSGFSRLPAACSVRFAGKGGPAKNEKYFNEAFLDINHSMDHGFVHPFRFLAGTGTSKRTGSGPLMFLDLLDPDPDPGGGGGELTREKVRGAIVHKAGRKYCISSL